MAKGIKTGGRVAGTPNRLTKELRKVLKDLLYQELETLSSHLDSLESKERLEILIKLLPYAVPKVESVNYQENEPTDWCFD